MNKHIFTIIALLSLVFMGCASNGTDTYTISGTVTLKGVGYEGVTVTLSGSPDITTTTDSSGNYAFVDLKKGSGYTVTPSLITTSVDTNDYTQSFSPPNLSVDISGSSVGGKNFEINVFEISGQVTMNGSGHTGVTMSMTGDDAEAKTTDGSGLYTFWVMNGTYTVTPTLAGQTLQPADITQTVNGFGFINNDFALDTYDIDGQVTLGGIGYQGATITLVGDAALALSTDAGGYYTFTVLNGTYDVTPSVTGQTLTPTDITSLVVSGADSTGNDFALDTHVLSGTVTWNSGGYLNAEVQLTGSSSDGEITYGISDYTDSAGAYSFSVLNGTYALTPVVTNQTLTPGGESGITVTGSASTGHDFALNTYTISGQVLLGTSGYPGATVNLTGPAFTTTTTDGSGNYSFTGLLNDNYTVTPDVAGETASPAFRDIILAGSNRTGNDFVLGANTITGRVTLNGAGYGGVTVTLTGSSSDTDTTDSSGEYLFVVLNGTYTVTPALTGQTLSPTDISSIVINESDSTNNDFALNTNALSGQVTLNGSGFGGVLVSLSGSTMADSTTTDGSGNYSFNVLNDTFTVTPSLTGQTLTPGSEPGITVSGSASTGHDFALDTYPISGQVTLLGTGYANATINLTGDLTDSTLTDGGGDYTLDVLNGSYTLTPAVTGQSLTPINIPVSISNAGSTGNNFAINTHTLSGTVTLNGLPYEGAAIALTGDASMAATTDASGNYSFADLVNGSYTVTPTVAGQTLDPVSLSPTILDADSTGNDFTINTYTISGKVTLNGSDYPGAQVALTGDATDSISTDGSGNYSFTGLVNGNYTVTPTVSGQTLSPTFTGITITDADSTGNDFAINTYTISGQVTLSGSGYLGATITLSGDAAGAMSTDATGAFSFTNLIAGAYTVTPSLNVNGQDQTFDNSSLGVTITTSDSTGNDFALDTYSISGTVTLSGSGYAGASVALSGAAAASTTTPASGDYTFTGLLNGSYTVTPTVGGQSLTPVDYDIDILGADSTGNDFTVSTNTISGQVTLNGLPYQGATITLTGAASMAMSTDASGNYSFAELLNGSYTVTPTVSGQTLNPADYDITINNTSSTGNDFTINTYTISGQVTLGGLGYTGSATIDLSGADTDSTTTDGSGNYSFTGLLSGDYTVTPSVSGQTLNPADRDITIGLSDSTGNDFALNTYSISGAVTLNSSGYSGASMALSGAASDSDTTDGAGNYSFTGLLNGTYTVTPTVTGQTLTPTSISSIAISGASSTGNDFVLDTYSLSGTVTLGGTGYSGVTVNLTGDATDSDSSDGSGNYSFTGLLNGSYTLTPSLSGQSFNPAVLTPSITQSDISNLDFAINTWSISGNVSNGAGPMEWISVSLSGDSTGSTRTDGSGDYSFANVLNGSYTVTPAAVPQTFSPASTSFTVSDSNETNVDFAVPSMIWIANVDATAATEDGYSWQTAFKHPQDAATAAGLAGTPVGDQVWVANGPYYAYMDTTDPTNPVLMLQEGFEYYGGFAGTETTLSERDLESNATTLDGLDVAQEIVVAADNSMLNGFVVYHGLVPAYENTYVAPVSAAGVSNFSVIDCVVTGNVASTGYHINGSAMNFGSGLIMNTLFRDNTGWNGPLFVFGNATDNVDIVQVISTNNNAYYGGGMLLGGEGPIRLLNSTIINNSTSEPYKTAGAGKGVWMHMGGAYLPSGDATVTNTIVYGDISGHGNTVGENLPVVSYSLLESFGSTYDAIWSDPSNIIATSVANTPNFVSWAASPVYVGNHPFQLASNSPCIDAGNDAAIPSTILIDYFGAEVDYLENTRSVDWPPATGGTGVDIGAYEFITPWEPGMP